MINIDLWYFRLTHDISPENFPEDLNDYDSDLKKEQFILSCLTTCAASPEVECTKDEGDEKQALSPLQIQQKTLEQLNNVINNQYHSAKNQSDRVSIKASGHVGPEEVPLIHEVQVRTIPLCDSRQKKIWLHVPWMNEFWNFILNLKTKMFIRDVIIGHTIQYIESTIYNEQWGFHRNLLYTITSEKYQ